tara:strand:- start:693 stop:863 length:171 start_codon:yes stop_codon:yes gene_type:complete
MFNNQGIQCPIDTLNQLEEHMSREIDTMVRRCKNNNVRRLTPDLLWVALGRYNPNL